MLKKIAKKIDAICHTELKRLLVYAGGPVLALAFVKQSINRDLEWMEYPAFAFSLLLLYAPQLAIHVIAMYKGQSKDASSEQK